MGCCHCCVCSRAIAIKYDADVRWEHLRSPHQLDTYSLSASEFTRVWLNLIKSASAAGGCVTAKSVQNIKHKEIIAIQPARIGSSDYFLRFAPVDEDLGDQTDIKSMEGITGLISGAIFVDSQNFPMDQRDPKFFPSPEVASLSIKHIFGDLFDDMPVTWSEFDSDEVFSLLAFEGIGMQYLTGMPSNNTSLHDPVAHASCQIDLSFMNMFECRKPYENYGCIAYFSLEKVPLAVYWCAGKKLVFPDDPEWTHVKFVFRSTLVTAVTAKDHLVHMHWQVSNTLLQAARQSLDCDHPIRRLIRPHTYRGAKVNWNSMTSLLPVRGLAYRTFAIGEEDFPKVLEVSVQSLKFSTFYEDMAAKNLPEAIARELPLKLDGEDLWAVIHIYTSGYVDIFYEDDAAVLADLSVRQFYAHYVTPAGWIDYQVPPLSKDALINLLTHAIFWITGGHEFLGGLIQYVLNPTGLMPRIHPGKSESDLDGFYLMAALFGSTVMKVPMLMDDWSHIHIHDRLSENQRESLLKVIQDFQRNLQKLSDTIAERNKSRRKPFESFNPQYLESSISV